MNRIQAVMNAKQNTTKVSLKQWFVLACTLILIVGVGRWGWSQIGRQAPIKVGLLHSLTGPMAISEKSMVDAEVLALEELRASGGLLGRDLEWVVADGKSDWPTFAREAQRLIHDEKVDVIVGCWTSASRKTVLPVIESNNHLLIYPMAYEGLEESPNVIYIGAAPNQQIIPAVTWAMRELKAKRFYMVGSDYIWPHSVHAIASDALEAIGAELAGESYLFFGTDKVDSVVQDIIASKPDVIISTVVGDTNKAFYRALDQAGMTSAKLPVISFSIAEDELRSMLKEMPAKTIVGHYSAWNYFQTIDREENRSFIRRFQKRYGSDRTINDTIAASYNSVFLWAQAVREAETTDVKDVIHAMSHQSLDAPEGIVSIDAENHHTWRPTYIGRARSDAQFDIVWTSETSIRPEPYPLSRSKIAWEQFLANLYKDWGNQWANPKDNAKVASLKPVNKIQDNPKLPEKEQKPANKVLETPKLQELPKSKASTPKSVDSPPVPKPMVEPKALIPGVKAVSGKESRLKPMTIKNRLQLPVQIQSELKPKTDIGVRKI